MSIYLGNLQIKQIEERLGITLTEEEREVFTSSHCHNASDIPAGQWHCYDLPFLLACGDNSTAAKLCEILKPYGSKMKCRFSIAIFEPEAKHADK